MERLRAADTAYRVTKAQLQAVEQSIREADRATDMAFAAILRERSGGLAQFVAFSRRQVSEIGPKTWMVDHLIEMLDREQQWLADTALEIAPAEGSS